MMDAAQIEHLAALARLQLTPEEKAGMQDDLTRVLGYFAELDAVDTEGVLEMQRPVSLVNVLREDTPWSPFPHAVVEALAPEVQGGFIRVPRTVDSE